MDLETSFWFALTHCSGLTHTEVHSLVGQWREGEGRALADLFEAKPEDLKWAGLGERQREGVARAQAELPAARAELDPCAVAGIEVVSCADPRYPRRLAETLGNSRPPLLFCVGNTRLLNEPSVAVIGSRKPSEPGLRFASETSAGLAAQGVGTVSGFAEGIDRRASWSALEAGGATVLFLPQGILTFGREGEELSRWLERGQVLAVSAFRPRADWQTPLAMARNAMIAGAVGDVVVGHSRSVGGAWEAARMALRQGKRVWVRADLNPNLGHGALASLGARAVEWPSEDFGAWIESLAARAHDEFRGKVERKRWTEASAMALLRTGSPADIHDACGITGSLLLRIIEGRESVVLERVEDLTEIKGLGEAAVEEILRAFDVIREPSAPAQLSLFPEIEEYPGWDGRIASETRDSASRQPAPGETGQSLVFPESEMPPDRPLDEGRPRRKPEGKTRTARRKDRKTSLLAFMASGLRADFLGCYGAQAPATPNIDRLAREGALLSRAYTSHSQDAPARATFLTGTSPRCHGVWKNGVKLTESAPTLASHLAALGYRTACVGKMHLNPYDAPFETRSKESRSFWEAGLMDRWTGPYYGFNQARLVLGHGSNALAGGHYANWLRAWHSESAALLDPNNARPGRTGRPEAYILGCRPQVHATHWIANQAAGFVSEYRDEPFFVFCSFADPHPPYAAIEEYAAGVDAQKLASALPVVSETRRKYPPSLRAACETHSPNADQIREIRTHYGAMIAQIDEAVGFLLAKLDELDLAERTLVVLTSDHGDLLGDYGLLGAGPFHYGPLVRVPSIWRLPGAIPPGATMREVFSHLDFAPTVCRSIGLPVPPQSQGCAFDALLRGETDGAVRDAALVEWESESPRRLSVKTVVAADCRMTYYAGESFGEFYDLKEDPQERNNQFDEMSGSERAAAMRSLLDLLADARA